MPVLSAHLVLGADTIAANLAVLYALNVVLVAEHEQGDACERGLLDEVYEFVAGEVHGVGVGAVHNVHDGVVTVAVPGGVSVCCEPQTLARDCVGATYPVKTVY